MNVKIKRALISVSDKRGLETLMAAFSDWGIELIASGGTRKHLESLGMAVTPIESVTGNPEAFQGRMKTLSFQVSSSLLFRRDDASDQAQASELGIQAIDLLIGNLYPFQAVVERRGTFDELIENIDIGGPTLIRSAAKNHHSVTVITSPEQYPALLEELKQEGTTSESFRRSCANRAFRLTAEYDRLIADTLSEVPSALQTFTVSEPLRYGENPHQSAWLMTSEPVPQHFRPLQGKPLSYNNLLDLDAALQSLQSIQSIHLASGAIVVKHCNPCGAATAPTSSLALERAWAADPVSAFGGILVINDTCDIAHSDFLRDKFIEILVARDFTDEALAALSQKKNLRVLKYIPEDLRASNSCRTIAGGMLVQTPDVSSDPIESVTQVPYQADWTGLTQFGIKLTQHFKSNAITLVAEDEAGYKLLGVGMGNPNRIVSVQQAIAKAHENGYQDLSQAILISDAFFPFPDAIEMLHKAGISRVLQPGGGIRDNLVIEKCDEYGIAMALTHTRHFNH